ncbi:immunoglobulin-like domain-containing protein [Clostridium sp. ZS2-4]|uniref:immunoglobulin-like domain-containing protein n=1 Tax=Clostridium sp. ZS2-4 TaxID=2987703 RepID=UPI00227C29DA|nr:immunoglobulin-like domain-containing protein [Clostridium sp. ZS2-4]MCY6354593.1 DUF5011 domain-containing protein [Clostridium sp. ZS2-4]
MVKITKSFFRKVVVVVMGIFIFSSLVAKPVKAAPTFSISKQNGEAIFTLDDAGIAPGTGISKEFYIFNDYSYSNKLEKISLNSFKLNYSGESISANDDRYKDFVKYVNVNIIQNQDSQQNRQIFNGSLDTLLKQSILLDGSDTILINPDKQIKMGIIISMDKEAGNSVQGLGCNFDLSFVCSYETGGSGHHSSSSRNRSSSNKITNEKPKITLLGAKTVNIKVGESYSDAGAEAYDKEDGNITDKIVVKGNVDTNTAGKYIITYNVKDSAGNKADEVTRTVVVEEEIIVPEEPEIPEGNPDKKRPVITLNGDSKIVVKFGEKYEELGATAVDDVDGDITDKIEIKVNGKDDEVNTNIPGNYIITYNVSDSAGNKAYEVTRIVVVKEIEKASDGEITVPEDKVPEGTPVLPKTGEENPFIYYLSGIGMVLSGVLIRKKDIKFDNE